MYVSQISTNQNNSCQNWESQVFFLEKLSDGHQKNIWREKKTIIKFGIMNK